MEKMVVSSLLFCVIAMMIIAFLYYKVCKLRKSLSNYETGVTTSCSPLPVLPQIQIQQIAGESQELHVNLPLNITTINPVLSEYDQRFLENLQSAIRENMVHGKVDIETLASKMCISRSQLNRRVKALTGLSTSNYSIRLRLMYACEQLVNDPEPSINSIAQRCGFEDSAYFARIFKQRIGIAPSTFRKNKNAKEQIKAIFNEQRKAD